MPDSYNFLPSDPDRLQLADGSPCKLDALCRRGSVFPSYAAALAAAQSHARHIGQPVRVYLNGDHRFYTEVSPDETI